MRTQQTKQKPVRKRKKYFEIQRKQGKGNDGENKRENIKS